MPPLACLPPAVCAVFAAAAGGDKVAFPADFDTGELYATKEAIDAVRAGRPPPGGTVLTLAQFKAEVDDKGIAVRRTDGCLRKGDPVAYAVMEKRTGWGAEYPDELRNGEWEYRVFGPDRKVNDKANLKSCFQCHKPHAGQDYVISLARLAGAAPGAKVEPRTGPGVVAIADFLFGPEKVEVAGGQKVTWVNTDDSPHQVAIVGKDLRTPVRLEGQSAALSFDPGAYAYICGLHPNMKGQIEVK